MGFDSVRTCAVSRVSKYIALTVATYDKKLHFSVPESGHFLFLGQNQALQTFPAGYIYI